MNQETLNLETLFAQKIMPSSTVTVTANGAGPT